MDEMCISIVGIPHGVPCILNSVSISFYRESTGNRCRAKPHRMVVLGLVTTKSTEVEPEDLLMRRIEEASRFIPVEQLAISPQCGFASTHHGNKLTMDDQKRKLELVVDLAQDIWGAA